MTSHHTNSWSEILGLIHGNEILFRGHEIIKLQPRILKPAIVDCVGMMISYLGVIIWAKCMFFSTLSIIIRIYWPSSQTDNQHVQHVQSGINPFTAKLCNLKFQPLEVVSR